MGFCNEQNASKRYYFICPIQKKKESESNNQVNGAITSSTNTDESHITPPAKRDGNSKSIMSKISRNNPPNKQFLDLQETTNKRIYDSQGTTLPKSGDSKNAPLLGLILSGTAFVLFKKHKLKS